MLMFECFPTSTDSRVCHLGRPQVSADSITEHHHGKSCSSPSLLQGSRRQVRMDGATGRNYLLSEAPGPSGAFSCRYGGRNVKGKARSSKPCPTNRRASVLQMAGRDTRHHAFASFDLRWMWRTAPLFPSWVWAWQPSRHSCTLERHLALAGGISIQGFVRVPKMGLLPWLCS